MYYLAYDVETAHHEFHGSICQIGWALFSNRGLIRSGGSLINPQTAFSPMCVRVHGITEADVKDAPTFDQYWDSTLGELMNSSLVVAYNALFDIRATAMALRRYRIPDPGIDYIDLLPVCRDLVPSEKHTLADMMAWSGSVFEHHNAQDDAMAIVRVLTAVRKDRHLRSFGEVLQISSACISASTHLTLPEEKPIPEPVETAPLEITLVGCHELDGLAFCVTGDYFEGAGRADVEAMITAHGGIVKAGVSKKVRYLISGDYKDYPAGYQSTKARKAQELRDAGVEIDIITMSALVNLIESRGAQ